MSQKQILCIIGMILAIIGLISIVLCILGQGENHVLLSFGLMSNSIAILLYFIVKKKKFDT